MCVFRITKLGHGVRTLADYPIFFLLLFIKPFDKNILIQLYIMLSNKYQIISGLYPVSRCIQSQTYTMWYVSVADPFNSDTAPDPRKYQLYLHFLFYLKYISCFVIYEIITFVRQTKLKNLFDSYDILVILSDYFFSLWFFATRIRIHNTDVKSKCPTLGFTVISCVLEFQSWHILLGFTTA